jgi:hypothetical protein
MNCINLILSGIFLMGAFYAAMKIQPRLQPKEDDALDYKSAHGGATIEVRYVKISIAVRSVNLLFREEICLTHTLATHTPH